MLETVAFLYGKKWSSMLIKRTYFGNWLRDYSQAVDVGSLKGVNAGTIRILVSNPALGLLQTVASSWLTCTLGMDSLLHGLWVCHG
jgi:uncharacterized membrane protein YbaN (DUF454 family)